MRRECQSRSHRAVCKQHLGTESHGTETKRWFENVRDCSRVCVFANACTTRINGTKSSSKSNSEVKAIHRSCVCKHETGRSQFDDSVCVGSTVEAIDDREWSIRTVNKREDAALRQHNNQINN